MKRKTVIKQGQNNWYSLRDPGSLPKEEWGKTEKRGKNGNVLLNVSNDHKHINHRELRLLLEKWFRHCFEGEGWREHMRDEGRNGGAEEKEEGNEGKCRLKQHCTAGCLLLLCHHSVTSTDTYQQRIFLHNQCLMHDVSNPHLIFSLTHATSQSHADLFNGTHAHSIVVKPF